MDKHHSEYDARAIRFLEMLWGEGFLSPGGPEEVDGILSGLQLSGMQVLDIGCGSGGIACYLVQRHEAKHLTGYDVESPAIEAARRRASSQGLSHRLKFVLGAAERKLPFPDEAFDLVFSKDAIVHVMDKETLFREVLRVLKPDGFFAAGDWMIGHDGEPTNEMLAYLDAEELTFHMASAERYRDMLASAGFYNINTKSRNDWYKTLAEEELEKLRGPFGEIAADELGPDYIEKNISTWKAMLVVLRSGEHCPTHFRAQKPVLRNGRTNSHRMSR